MRKRLHAAVFADAFWQVVLCWVEREFRVLFEEPANDLDVFLGLDGTGAVEDMSAMFNQGCRVVEDCLLGYGHFADIVDLPAPFDIGLLR